jgi:hypothetical protein
MKPFSKFPRIVIFALFTLTFTSRCFSGVSANKDDLMLLMMQNITGVIRNLNLRFYFHDSLSDADTKIQFQVPSNSITYSVLLNDSDLLINKISIYPFYPSSAAGLGYQVMHANHNAGTSDESAIPMEGGPFSLSDFHIENALDPNGIPTGDAFIGPYMKMSGNFNSDYMTAKIEFDHLYLKVTIDTSPSTTAKPFEIMTGPVTIYVDSGCKINFNSDNNGYKNIELPLKDIFKDNTTPALQPFVDTLYTNGGIATVNPWSHPDLLTLFENNITKNIKEYGCVNGSYLF